MILTPLCPNASKLSLIRVPTRRIIPISKHPRQRTIIPNSEMIIPPRRAAPAYKPLKRHRRALNLVENSLPRRCARLQVQIVEERRDGVVGDVGRGELLAGVLRAAVGEGEEAVGGGEDVGVAGGVDADGEREGDLAVGVVFVVARWVAEVARGRRGQDQVGGGGGRGRGCGGCGGAGCGGRGCCDRWA